MVIILVECALRVALISDMEYKADERENVYFLSHLDGPWTALAPISNHAGFCSSSGFYYLVRLLSFASHDPLTMGRAIAWCNAVCLAVALWLARRLPALWLALVMCATSISMVVYSRKIWQPDLVPAWAMLATVLLARALAAERPRARRAFLAAGAVSLVGVGHMYLAAGLAAATVGLVVWLHLARVRAWRDAWTWAGACTVATASFIPWLHAVGHGARGPSGAAARLALGQLPPIVEAAAAGPAPYSFYKLYIEPIWPFLTRGRGEWRLSAFYLCLWIAIVCGAALFWAGLARLAHRWRATARDPLLVAALALLVTNSLALFLIRMGSHPHYWLALFPFSAYLVASAALLEPASRLARSLRAGIALFCVASALATVLFLIVVRAHHGLPGEYGPAYANQLSH